MFVCVCLSGFVCVFKSVYVCSCKTVLYMCNFFHISYVNMYTYASIQGSFFKRDKRPYKRPALLQDNFLNETCPKWSKSNSTET